MHPYDEILVSRDTVDNLSNDYIYYLIHNLFDENNDNYEKLASILCYTRNYDELIIGEILDNNNINVLDIYIDSNRRYQDVNHQLLPIVLNANLVISAFNWAMCVGTHAAEMLNILINNPTAHEAPVIYAYWIKNELYHSNALKLKIIEFNMTDEVVRILNRVSENNDYTINNFYSTLPDYTQLNIMI